MEGVGARFEMELELMNCLASPEYLHCEPLLWSLPVLSAVTDCTTSKHALLESTTTVV